MRRSSAPAGRSWWTRATAATASPPRSRRRSPSAASTTSTRRCGGLARVTCRCRSRRRWRTSRCRRRRRSRRRSDDARGGPLMAGDVIMPALGMAQDTGTVLRWLKSEGDAVAAGEPLMEVETDKATVEVEAPCRRHPGRRSRRRGRRRAGRPGGRACPGRRRGRPRPQQPQAAVRGQRRPPAAGVAQGAADRGRAGRRHQRTERIRAGRCRHRRRCAALAATPGAGTRSGARASCPERSLWRIMAERTTAELADRAALLPAPAGRRRAAEQLAGRGSGAAGGRARQSHRPPGDGGRRGASDGTRP